MPRGSKSDTTCIYRPDGFSTKLIWLLVGWALGFLSSIYLTHSQEKKHLESKVQKWVNSVVSEIELNIEWGTNPAGLPFDDPASITMKRHFSYSALQSFLDLLPEFQFEQQDVEKKGRKLLDILLRANQPVNQRNQIRNDMIIGSKSSIASLGASRVKAVAEYDATIEDVTVIIRDLGLEFKEQLLQIQYTT